MVERHQHFPAVREPAERLFQFGWALALDEQGDRWGEAEVVLRRAIEAGEFLAPQGEGRGLDGAFRPRLAGPISLDPLDLGIPKSET